MHATSSATNQGITIDYFGYRKQYPHRQKVLFGETSISRPLLGIENYTRQSTEDLHNPKKTHSQTQVSKTIPGRQKLSQTTPGIKNNTHADKRCSLGRRAFPNPSWVSKTIPSNKGGAKTQPNNTGYRKRYPRRQKVLSGEKSISQPLLGVENDTPQ